MRLYLTYLRMVARVAFNGSVGGALNWSPIIGVSLLGAILSHQKVALVFEAGWRGTVANAVIYATATWLVIFIGRFFLVAPFQLWRSDRTAPEKAKLMRFYTALADLRGQRIDRDDPDAPIKVDQFVNQADEHVTMIARWIGENLGTAARTRFLDRSTLMAASISGAVNARHNSCLLSLDRFQKNLSSMIETEAWG